MPRFYRYLYYRLYCWNLNGFSGWKDPELATNAAVAAFIGILFINLWTVLELVEYFFKFTFATTSSEYLAGLSGVRKICFFLAVMLSFFLIVGKRSYWTKMVDEFSGHIESGRQKTYRSLGILMYIIGSGVACYIAMSLNTG